MGPLPGWQFRGLLVVGGTLLWYGGRASVRAEEQRRATIALEYALRAAEARAAAEPTGTLPVAF